MPGNNYKMGMIHERAVNPEAGNLDDTSPEAFTAEIRPESVMELPDRDELDEGALGTAH